jgi:hypothetical protein
MRRIPARISVILSTVVVILVGSITMLGLLVGDDLGLLSTLVTLSGIRTLAQFFVQLSVVTISLTIILGIINLLAVNVMRILRGSTLSARLNSVVILASFIAALLLYTVDRSVSGFLLQEVQVTIESALAALLFFALVYGAFRLLRDRVTAPRLLFLLAMLFVLTAALPFAALQPFQQLTDWLIQVPVNAGARGILLGVALGTMITGLRVLIGQDRTYGE